MAAPEGYVWVIREDEVQEGIIYPFAVGEEDRILVKVEGRLSALDGICTHEYAELAEGEIEDETVYCPLHSSGFNVFTGDVTNLPAVIPLPVYEVRVEDGDVYVAREPKPRD